MTLTELAETMEEQATAPLTEDERVRNMIGALESYLRERDE